MLNAEYRKGIPTGSIVASKLSKCKSPEHDSAKSSRSRRDRSTEQVVYALRDNNEPQHLHRRCREVLQAPRQVLNEARTIIHALLCRFDPQYFSMSDKTETLRKGRHLTILLEGTLLFFSDSFNVDGESRVRSHT